MIPRRVTFSTQMIACVWSSIEQIAVMNWALSTIKTSAPPPSQTTTPVPTAASSSTTPSFGAPSAQHACFPPARPTPDYSTYSSLLWFFLAGALFPILIYAAARIFPKHSLLRFHHVPLVFGGAKLSLLGRGRVHLQQAYLNRFREWWMQYNYLSAGLDLGLALCTILILLTLNLTSTGFPSWWGRQIASETMDAKNTAVQIVLPEGETFGPASWYFSGRL